jgi:hypothetical protein
MPQLEPDRYEVQLAISHWVNAHKINDGINEMSIDEYLALRAKKAGNEGLLAARKLLRTGLGIASEISGERISYNTREGKISSIEFETRIFAFSIPLTKNQTH